jgi:5-hydroxyisourate hydrolase-like protein (transthyretin family)
LVGCTVGGVAASAANFFKDDAAGIAVTLVFDTIPLKVTVTDATSGDPITDARVYLHKEGDTGTVYFEDETDVNGEVNDAIAYPGDTDVVGWARQFDISGNDYVQKNIAGTITDTGLSIAVALERVT